MKSDILFLSPRLRGGVTLYALLKAKIEQNVMFFGVSPPWNTKSLYIRRIYKDIEKLLEILSEEIH